MKLYTTLFLALASKTLSPAQLSKILSTEEAGQQMLQNIDDNNLAALTKLLQQYPEAIDTLPAYKATLKDGDGVVEVTWPENSTFPLKHAACNYKALCILLEYGANPNLQSEGGWTALMTAANACLFACIQILIEAQASKELEAFAHRTALSLIEENAKFIQNASAERLEEIRTMTNKNLKVSELKEILKMYHQTIADGEAERDRYAQEKPLALQEITNAIGIKDLATIIHGYAYGVLPRDLPRTEKIEQIQAQKKSFFSFHCEIQ